MERRALLNAAHAAAVSTGHQNTPKLYPKASRTRDKRSKISAKNLHKIKWWYCEQIKANQKDNSAYVMKPV